MKRKPWPLVVLAFIHLLAPIGNIFVNSYLMGIEPAEYLRALLHPVNMAHAVIFFGIPILSAGLIYHCKKWSYLTYIGIMSIPFIYSFISWSETPGIMTGVVLVLFYLVNISIVGYFLLPAVRKVYFDPKLRWWETKPRYATDYQAEIFFGEKKHVGQVKNVSENGLFVESQAIFSLNENLKINFNASDEKFEFSAQAVYHRNETPTGYGIKLDINTANEDRLLKLIARLKDEGAKVSSRAPGPEDSFSFWLKNMFKSKKAWIPQAPTNLKK